MAESNPVLELGQTSKGFGSASDTAGVGGMKTGSTGGLFGGYTPWTAGTMGGQITFADPTMAGVGVPTYGQMLAASAYNANQSGTQSTALASQQQQLAAAQQAMNLQKGQDVRAGQAQAFQQQMAAQAAAQQAQQWAQQFAAQQALTQYQESGSDIVRQQSQGMYGTIMPALQQLLPMIQGGTETALNYLKTMGGNLGNAGYQDPGMAAIIQKILGPLKIQQEQERQSFENNISGAGRQVESPVFQPARSAMNASQQATMNAEQMKALFAQRGLDLQTMSTVLQGIPQITGASAPLMQMLTQLYGNRQGMGTL